MRVPREPGADARRQAWRPSLFLHYLVLLTALLAPILAVVAYVGLELRDRYRADVDRRLESTARSLAVAVERAFQRHTGALEAFAVSPDFGFDDAEPGGDMDLPRLYQHAVRAAEALGTNIVVIRPDMGQVFNTLKPLGAELPKTGGAEVARRVFETGAPQMSDLVFGQVAQRYAIGFSVPVRDQDGQVALVVAAPMDPAVIADVLARGMSGQAGFATLADANGKIIARSERSEDFVGASVLDWWREATRGREQGHVVGEDLQGREVLISYVPVAEAPNWRLAVGLPVADYEDYWRRPVAILIAGLVGAVLLGLGLSFLLARQVQKPMTALAGFARERAEAIRAGAPPDVRPLPGAGAPVRELRELRDGLEVFQVEVVRRDDEQRRLVARLETALRDRDVLLGEVYHRVKNNLQQILALIVLKSSVNRSEDARDALAFVTQRVQALARVHQLLLQTSAPSNMDAHDFFRSLCEAISKAYDLDGRNIRISVEADRASLTPDRAITLGLIATELVENALRHAFVGRESGEIRLRYRHPEEGGPSLTISDDGVGFAEGPKSEGAGLGASIVAALARQLKGEVISESGADGGLGGVSVTVQLPPRTGKETP